MRFHRFIGWCAVLSLAALCFGGCQGDLDYTGMEALPCDDEGRPDWLVDVMPAEPATYIELRWMEDGAPGFIESSVGTPCAEASDLAACQQALEAAAHPEGFELEPCPECIGAYTLVVNRGDTVEALGTREEIIAFFGEIDTPLEAAFRIDLTSERRVGCTPGARASGDGFEVAAEEGCNGEVIVKIDRDGSTDIVDERSGDDCGTSEQIE